uniref:G-protein coupled receptors family 3 profile domain-containing protein n=1 Tax=Timema monikensis TaxID=170555 RepID=A0A7R9HKN4_9NEOP|nr:unnamed protein product [Timema monikensis]
MTARTVVQVVCKRPDMEKRSALEVLYRACVVPIVTHAAETWTLNVRETRKGEAMGMKFVFITCTMIAVEVGVSAAMLVLEPPAPGYVFPAQDRVALACNTSPLGVMAPLAFDFFLITLCTLYALKTRNVPENFNEAKFIGFAMYTTCVIWVAFVPIYFGSDSKCLVWWQVITMCMCVTLSAMVTLVFLFLPKMYIILLRPERNNRSFFTTAKSIRCHIGSRVASAISDKSSNSYSGGESPRSRSDAFRKPDPGTVNSYPVSGADVDRRGGVSWRGKQETGAAFTGAYLGRSGLIEENTIRYIREPSAWPNFDLEG